MVCLGTKSVESAKKASRRFGRIIQKLGYNVKFQNFKVWNLVGRCEIKTTVPLDKFMGFLSKNDAVDASWNPELFPSLTYRLSGDKPKVSLNVFKTGKVTITGAKHHREMVHVFNSFHQVSNMNRLTFKIRKNLSIKFKNSIFWNSKEIL